MSTIVLENKAVAKVNVKPSLKERIVKYFVDNRKSIMIGMLTLNGRDIDSATVRMIMED